MDNTSYFQQKAMFLNQQKDQGIVRLLEASIEKILLQECDVRLFSSALIRAATFDLSYLLLRHRPWHAAPLLAELAIDFLKSEFLFPHQSATLVVESTLDLIHSCTLAETGWGPERYDEEFLEHLFTCSLMARHDGELAIDLGFGRNLIELLQAAMQLEQSAGVEDAFQFAPELTTRLHGIIQRIFAEASAAPWILDLFRMKNLLQRDAATRKGKLDRPELEKLMRILTLCGTRGASAEVLEQGLAAELRLLDLALLQRCGLIFEEAGRRPQDRVYQLSHRGQELTCQSFAHDSLKAQTPLSLRELPALYQSALLQLLWQQAPAEATALIAAQSRALSPEALKFVIEAWKKPAEAAQLLGLFRSLLTADAHAWIRVEICRALPLPDERASSQGILSELAEKDLSPMVRAAARSALKESAAASFPAPSGSDSTL